MTQRKNPKSFPARVWEAMGLNQLGFIALVVGAFVAAFDGDPVHAARAGFSAFLILPVLAAAFVGLTPAQRRDRRPALASALVSAALVVAITITGGFGAGLLSVFLTAAAFFGGRYAV